MWSKARINAPFIRGKIKASHPLMTEAVCLGILVADVIARPVSEYPARGELRLVDEVRPFIGGCAANTGIGLQMLGVETLVVGKVGNDGFGTLVRDELGRYGVDARGVSTHPDAPTSATLVTVAPDGERSFLHCLGANARFEEDDVPWDLLQGAKLLHIAGHFLLPAFDGESCARVLQRAQALGLRTSLDTAGHPAPQWYETLRPVLPYVDYFLPSLSEARFCVEGCNPNASSDVVARALLDAGVKTVALTKGEAGSYLARRDPNGREESLHLPAYRVASTDATGAGDAFSAGFLCGVLRDLSLRECGLLGNACGALCATQLGTVAGCRSFEVTRAFVAEHTS